jgi:drug/metabolite transporter (DMT)-like permease
VAGRALADQVPPFSAAFLRFVLAAVPLSLMMVRIHGRFPKITIRMLGAMLLLGLTGVFCYNLFFFKGLHFIPAGRASIIIANNPIVIALASAFFFKEKLTAVKIMGILMSVSGAIFAISKGDFQLIRSQGIGIGDGYILLAVLSWVTYSLIGKRVMRDYSAIQAVACSSLFGAVLLFPAALYEGLASDFLTYTLSDWFNLAYLGIFGTVLGFVWYYEGINKLGPSRASIFINFVPISAIIMAFFVLGEPITASLLIGAALVTAGVYLVSVHK